jgi:hypothetical protein
MRRITARTATLSAIFLAGALALGGCSAAGGGSSDSFDGGSAPVAPDESVTGGGESAAEDGDFGTGGAAVTDNRDLITIGTVTVTTEDPIAAARDAVRIVEGAGGRIDSRSEHSATEEQGGYATLTLRIPASELTSTLDRIKDLGTDDEVDIKSTDVTAEHQDLEARISAQRTMITNLQVLMSKATSIDDLISLEATIADRQADLESLEAQQRGLEDQISMSTITLTLTSDPIPVEEPPTEPANFWTGLGVGWDAFVGFWSGFLVILAVLLPWLVTAAIVTVVIVYVVRWNARRQAAKPRPPAPPMPGVTLPPPPVG